MNKTILQDANIEYEEMTRTGTILIPSMLEPGVYHIELWARNSEGESVTDAVIYVVPYMMDLTLTVNDQFAFPGSSIIFYLSIPLAAYSSISMSYGDGKEDTQALTSLVTDLPMTFSHHYSIPGVYTVLASVENPLQKVETNVTVTVGWGVSAISMTAAASEMQAQVIFTLTDDRTPTGVQAVIDFGDQQTTMTTLEFSDVKKTVNVFHDYDALGTYIITSVILNPFEEVTREAAVTIGDEIDSVNVSCSHEVIAVGAPFQVLVFVAQGSNLLLSVNFNDNSEMIDMSLSSQTLKQQDHIYTKAGDYEVTISIHNSVSKYNEVCAVRVATPIESLTLLSDDPKKVHELVTYQLDALNADGACFYIDYGDGSNELLGPSKALCQEGEYHSDSFKTLLNTSVTVSHAYSSASAYTVIVHVWNAVSSRSTQKLINVVQESEECSTPEAEIYALSQDPSFPTTFKRTDTIQIRWRILMLCSPPRQGVTHAEVIGVQPPTNTPLKSVDNTLEMTILPKQLEIGLYKVKLTTYPENVPEASIYKEAYFRIMGSPLVATIVGGVTRTLPSGQSVQVCLRVQVT